MARTNNHSTMPPQVALTEVIQPDNSHNQMIPDHVVSGGGSLPSIADAISHVMEIFEHDDGQNSAVHHGVNEESIVEPDSGQNPQKTVKWLKKTGITTALSATAAILWRTPGGVFSHQKQGYYIILIVILIMGLIEVCAASWVARSRIARVVVWLAVVPLVLVAGVGGSTVLAI